MKFVHRSFVMLRFFTSLAALLLLAGVLTGCGTSKEDKAQDDTIKTEKEAEVKAPTPICPQVAILRDLDVVQDYGAQKPDASELVAQAKMTSVMGDCGYDKGGIDIKFDLNFIAAKGPRLGGLHTSFPYFIAVVDPDEHILNKEHMTVDINFSSGSKIQDHSESLHVFLPLRRDQQPTGPNYRVLMGFQLTQDQLDAVKKKREVKR